MGGKGGGSIDLPDQSAANWMDYANLTNMQELTGYGKNLRTGLLRDYESLLGITPTSPLWGYNNRYVYETDLRNTPASQGGYLSTGGGQGGQGAQGNTYGGYYDPTALPTYKPLFGLQKQSLEDQYQQARKNIMSQNPEGGNLSGALANLEANRAATMGSAPAEIATNLVGDMLNKAYGIAFNMPTSTIAGYSNLASNATARQNAQVAAAAQQYSSDNAANAGLWGGIGTGIGKLAGGALGK